MNGSGDFTKIIRAISDQENFEAEKTIPLRGGNNSQVYLISSADRELIIKINSASAFPDIFQSESLGLQTLKDSGSNFRIPEVLFQGALGDFSYLGLEYLAPGKKESNFWDHFARGLAALHKNTAPSFGFSSSNYIGSLPQYNEFRTTAAEFYISQRLEPQLKMATNKGFQFRQCQQTLRNIESIIPKEPPALIHGDLWSGNYLVTKEGTPGLIDPAVSYASREMDLAMMKLFGGFPEEVFQAYAGYYSLQPSFQERVSLWQLYYLLVHLNIFGKSYFGAVQKIISEYS